MERQEAKRRSALGRCHLCRIIPTLSEEHRRLLLEGMADNDVATSTIQEFLADDCAITLSPDAIRNHRVRHR